MNRKSRWGKLLLVTNAAFSVVWLVAILLLRHWLSTFHHFLFLVPALLFSYLHDLIWKSDKTEWFETDQQVKLYYALRFAMWVILIIELLFIKAFP